MGRMRAPSALAALVLLASARAVAAQERHVHTDRKVTRLLPLPKEEGVFHFIIFGDRTGGPPEGIQVLAQAVSDTNLLGPDLVMTVGDLVQGYNATPLWMKQMTEFRATMDKLTCRWFPVAGNHDVYYRGADKPPREHEGNYEKHFGPLWYWFRHKNAAFFVLYTDEGDPKTGEKGFKLPQHTQMSPEQLAWLTKSLQEAKGSDHVFVFLHHPRWISDSYPGSNWDAVHKALVAAGNVTAVFAGHIHQMRYDGKKDGIEYFALATTGGELKAELPEAGLMHHMNLVTVRKDAITVATIPVGAVIDPRELTPLRVAEIERLAKAPVDQLSGPLPIATEAAVSGTVKLKLSNPTSRPVEVTASAAGPGWVFFPDHQHARVPAQSTAEVELDYWAGAGAGQRGLQAPVATILADYLTETARISLPRRAVPLEVQLESVPAAAFVAAESTALRLDGKADCLRVTSPKVGLPDGPFTVEGWLRARDFKGRRGFLNKAENSEFGLFVSEGRPSFVVHLAGKYASAGAEGAVLKVDHWHHLAGVFDGEEVRLYLDGQLLARAPGKGKRTPNQLPLLIGADPDKEKDPGSFFAGWIDEVRLSKTVRYEGERFVPARRLEPDADTLLLFHLDRQIGPFVPDHSPRGRHAEVLGSPRCETVPPAR
jgi:hypothetical protein